MVVDAMGESSLYHNGGSGAPVWILDAKWLRRKKPTKINRLN
jgi:hypothetical protein